MKALKLAVLPMALLATSAFAEEIVVVDEVAEVTTTTYDADSGMVKNTTTQLVDGTKTLFKTAMNPGAVSAEIGTLGYGANISWSLNDKTELQVGWSGGNIDVDTDVGGTDSIINWKKVLGGGFENYDGNLKMEADMSNPYLGVQMRPMSNWLTVGTGVIFANNDYSVKLANKEQTQYKQYDIPADTTIAVNVEYENDIAPYLTVGFRPNLDKKWGMFGEVGAVYVGESQNRAKIILSPDASGKIPEELLTTSGGKQKVTKVEQEIQQKFDDKLSKWYPIAKVGLTYRF